MRTALVLAAIQDDVETCKLLVEKGNADVNIRDKVKNSMKAHQVQSDGSSNFTETSVWSATDDHSVIEVVLNSNSTYQHRQHLYHLCA